VIAERVVCDKKVLQKHRRETRENWKNRSKMRKNKENILSSIQLTRITNNDIFE
jgi:hypothetical protein